MAESDIRDLLAKRLAEVGFEVFTEVPCRFPDQWSGTGGRIDILALVPPTHSIHAQFRTLGFEVKDRLGDEVNAVLQAGAYMNAFHFVKNSKTLPRPDIVCVSRSYMLSAASDGSAVDHDTHTGTIERVAWKRGVAILERKNGAISFQFPLHDKTSRFVLFHAKGTKGKPSSYLSGDEVMEMLS